MTTHIDYTAARERLSSITTDPAALAGLDRIRATGELDDGFMAAVDEHRISLDWLAWSVVGVIAPLPLTLFLTLT